ncbi:MAG TPA: hypothetical protein VGJ05_06165 [Fimbriiglobus sp.]|jgi:hypothetical protein
MSVTLPNGTANSRPQQRKQLSDQLDRFDEILDGLADGLNEAMADAAREGTRLAVKDAILEILSNPDLRALIARSAEPGPAKPSFWARLKVRVARAKAAVVEAVTPAVQFAARKVRAVIEPVIGVGRALAGVWQWKKALLVGLGVGLVTTAVCLTASHGFAAVVSGIGGAVTAVAIQLGMWVKKTALKLRMV